MSSLAFYNASIILSCSSTDSINNLTWSIFNYWRLLIANYELSTKFYLSVASMFFNEASSSNMGNTA